VLHHHFPWLVLAQILNHVWGGFAHSQKHYTHLVVTFAVTFDQDTEKDYFAAEISHQVYADTVMNKFLAAAA
jgi:hypothetical protein